MNTYEIDDARELYRNHPVLSRATRILFALRDLADANSDGWCYWNAPSKAANKLMTLIVGARADFGRGVTEEGLKKAMTPIKAFLTRRDEVFKHERHLIDIIRDTQRTSQCSR